MIQWLQDWLRGNTFGAARSGQWSAVRNAFIKENPFCAVCVKRGSLLQPNEVHHLLPFHLHPNLELDPDNFIVFCRPHHILVGHLMNWSSYNLNAKTDAEAWRTKIANRP